MHSIMNLSHWFHHMATLNFLKQIRENNMIFKFIELKISITKTTCSTENEQYKNKNGQKCM